MKKFLWTVLFCSVLLAYGGCKPMDGSKVLKGKEGVFAQITTTRGDIFVELYYKATPLTVTNFVGLAEGTLDATNGKHFYDGLKFHRVISDFMIQGGDPKGNGTGGPGYKFADEIVDSYKFSGPGVLAMANAGAGTNGSQFFITHVPTPWLNGHHTIFGHVVNDDSQKVVNAVKQGDVIKSVTIYRLGSDAQQFTATQEDFDRRSKEAEIAKRKAQELKLADKIAEVEKRFPGYAKDENGIYYKITKEGSGSKCGKGRNVAIEYKGYFITGEVFDQSAGRGPLEFVTNSGNMIPGFDVTVQDMKLGEKRTVVLPPDMAYGEQGLPGVIPGNSFLAFDIELTKIK